MAITLTRTIDGGDEYEKEKVHALSFLLLVGYDII
jgi:hypothetical protein